MNRVCLTIICGVFCLVSASYADTGCYGQVDFDEDGMVTGADFQVFLECVVGPDVTEPPPGCSPDTFARADLDGDGDVDLHDASLMSKLAGFTYFDYGPSRNNLEAELLAMAVSRQLRAPDTEYDRILRDLDLIREEYNDLRSVIDDEDYVPTEMLVGVDDTVPLDDYHTLNEFYGVLDEEIHTFYRLLTFCDNLNMPELGPKYETVPGINYAEPNYWIGIDDYITIEVIGDVYRYNIDDGFLDCFDGCDCHREWLIDVDQAGTVTLISYEEWGYSYCNF